MIIIAAAAADAAPVRTAKDLVSEDYQTTTS
jgi:hypothetical protein